VTYGAARRANLCKKTADDDDTSDEIAAACGPLWPPCVADADIIFASCGFFFLSIFFPRSPNVSRRRLGVYSTSKHGVALVLIYDAGLKRAATGSLKIKDAKNFQKFATCAPSHNFVGLYLRN